MGVLLYLPEKILTNRKKKLGKYVLLTIF